MLKIRALEIAGGLQNFDDFRASLGWLARNDGSGNLILYVEQKAFQYVPALLLLCIVITVWMNKDIGHAAFTCFIIC